MKTDTILKLQPNSYKHSKIKLLNPVSGHASLCVDSDLVIIGGCNISALNKVEIFKDNR